MRLRSVIIVLLLLLAGAAALFLFSRFFREQPVPYVLIEPPAWLPARTLPTTDMTIEEGDGAVVPEFPFGARKALRMATLRNDDAQAAGLATLSVYERGSSVSLEVFLPPLSSGDGYDASIILQDGSAVVLGSPTDRGDGWHALQKDFPARDLSAAANLRVVARTPQESLTNGMTVVDAPFFDAMD